MKVELKVSYFRILCIIMLSTASFLPPLIVFAAFLEGANRPVFTFGGRHEVLKGWHAQKADGLGNEARDRLC